MDRRTAILDSAERRARKGGYYGFSFRDIAEDVGVKSASVHYHFPTKEALVEALGDRYLERAKEALGNPADHPGVEGVQRVADLFLTANETDDLMCLCGIFGAELAALPAAIQPKIAAYFDYLTEWLTAALGDGAEPAHAQAVVAALEGGLILARTKDDPAVLRTIVQLLQTGQKVRLS